MTTYGTFPGVQVDTAGGGITAVAIGQEEKLILFGRADYQDDGTFTSDGDEDPLASSLSGSVNTAEQINARREADTTFGSGTELADGMREALANNANIDYLYGVAPSRYNAVAESFGTQTGTLANVPIWEDAVSDDANIQNLAVTDTTGPVDMTEELTYRSPPNTPSSSETIAVNPLTGEFAADAAPDGSYEFDYKYLDWQGAFDAADVTNVVNEDETGIYCALSDSDQVSADLQSTLSTRRNDFQLVNGLSGALPNDVEVITSDGESLATDHSNYTRRDARYDTGSFSQGSVDADYYFKFAPVRELDVSKTVLGGVAGLFAGNAIDNPIYNDALNGYSDLEQRFTKTDADNVRDDNVIPIRDAGSIRVKGNISTSTATDWERDFWRRRIIDRVILIGKTIGDQIIGEINDAQTRASAQRLIETEIRELVDDRLLKPNTSDTQNWYVDVYEDSSNSNEVNIDIGITPYGVVKRIDEQITINA